MATNCLSAPWDVQPISGGSSQYYDLQTYIECAVPRLWGYAQIIFVAVAIIMVLRLIYKAATNRDNSTVLEQLQKEWPYTILLAIVAIGGAGTLLNIVLKFLGLGGVDEWLHGLNDFIKIF